MDTKTVYNTLCKPNVLAAAAFCWGMSQTVKLESKTLDAPLSVLGSGLFNGSFYAIGGILIAACVPPELNGLVTIFCAAAILKQKSCELKKLWTDRNGARN
jgi:hypothetical protein